MNSTKSNSNQLNLKRSQCWGIVNFGTIFSTLPCCSVSFHLVCQEMAYHLGWSKIHRLKIAYHLSTSENRNIQAPLIATWTQQDIIKNNQQQDWIKCQEAVKTTWLVCFIPSSYPLSKYKTNSRNYLCSACRSWPEPLCKLIHIKNKDWSQIANNS